MTDRYAALNAEIARLRGVPGMCEMLRTKGRCGGRLHHYPGGDPVTPRDAAQVDACRPAPAPDETLGIGSGALRR